MMTQPHVLVNMCFILSGDISPRPVKDFVGSVLGKFQKHCDFILATIYAAVLGKFQKYCGFILTTTCADTRILTGVYGLGLQT